MKMFVYVSLALAKIDHKCVVFLPAESHRSSVGDIFS